MSVCCFSLRFKTQVWPFPHPRHGYTLGRMGAGWNVSRVVSGMPHLYLQQTTSIFSDITFLSFFGVLMSMVTSSHSQGCATYPRVSDRFRSRHVVIVRANLRALVEWPYTPHVVKCIIELRKKASMHVHMHRRCVHTHFSILLVLRF